MAHRLWGWQARKKVSKALSEKEKKILETLGNTISKMSEGEKDYLLGFAEGMAAMKEKKTEKEEKAG